MGVTRGRIALQRQSWARFNKARERGETEGGESLACQITFPFNQKDRLFFKVIFLIMLEKTSLLLDVKLSGKPVSPLLR